MSEATLQVDAVTAGYRPGLPIVFDLSLHASAGEVVTVMGPNGAGKSTLVKVIARLLNVDAGSVRVNGRDLARVRAHELASFGVACVPQSANVFTRLSVQQNLAVSARRLSTGRAGAVASMLARFPALREKHRQPAGQLSGGQRQLLSVAMALLCQPSLLLMDEPTAGLAPNSANEMLTLLRGIADDGASVLLVEQNARAALRVSDRGYVLSDGRNQLEARADSLLKDPVVADIYLGGRARA